MPKDKNNLWPEVMRLFVLLSAWVAFPVIIALLIGSWFDRQYGTTPWGLLGFIGSAFIVSNVGIVIEAKKAIRDLSRPNTNKSTENQNHE